MACYCERCLEPISDRAAFMVDNRAVMLSTGAIVHEACTVNSDSIVGLRIRDTWVESRQQRERLSRRITRWLGFA